jgi:hypothetical protein
VKGLGFHRTRQQQAWAQRRQGSTAATGATAPTCARMQRCPLRGVHLAPARGRAILPQAGRQSHRAGCAGPLLCVDDMATTGVIMGVFARTLESVH